MLSSARSLPQIPLYSSALPSPRRYRPNIALIGCGNIAASHLAAYRRQGWKVAVLCDQNLEAAERRREAYYPTARTLTDPEAVFADPAIDVVDLALHPAPRFPLMEAAIRAGKHVLSQKPFVLDLAEATHLSRLADENGVRVAVNMNARWAPYMDYLHRLCRERVLGTLQTVQIHIQWDHTWIRGMDFEDIHHVLLYDFALHWLDMTRLFFGSQSPRQVFASVRRAADSTVRPPLLGSLTIAFDQGCASLCLDGECRLPRRERLILTGSQGVVRAWGDLHSAHQIEVNTPTGTVFPIMYGNWYDDGFAGAMGELLCAIEEEREPSHGIRDQMETLELLFAAVAAADRGAVVRPGEVRRVGANCRVMRPDQRLSSSSGQLAS